MKKICSDILGVLILLFLTGCNFQQYYDCEICTEKKLYSRAVEGKIFDPEIEEYTVDGNIFLNISEADRCKVKSKANTEFRFMFEVFTKNEQYEFKIENISLIIDGKEHNINEYLTRYFPYESEVYTSFKQSSVVPDYYWSIYHFGIINFPTPKNKRFEICVKVSDSSLNTYSFNYRYSINFIHNLFQMMV